MLLKIFGVFRLPLKDNLSDQFIHVTPVSPFDTTVARSEGLKSIDNRMWRRSFDKLNEAIFGDMLKAMEEL
jgi:hypothetical protein